MVERLERDAADAMQRYWNDWCSDTGTIPAEFTIRGPRTTRVYADFRHSGMASRVAAALLPQLREQRETERWHCTVEGRITPCGTCDGCRWHISSLRAALAAAERTVRDQREVIEAADRFIRACDSGVIGADVAGERELRSALAALAPGTEGEPGGRCNAYGGTMPDGRVRTCDKSRWHSDSHTYEFIAALAPDTEGTIGT
jgi:hypothetical protein